VGRSPPHSPNHPTDPRPARRWQRAADRPRPPPTRSRQPPHLMPGTSPWTSQPTPPRPARPPMNPGCGSRRSMSRRREVTRDTAAQWGCRRGGLNPAPCCPAGRGRSADRRVTCDSRSPTLTARARREPAVSGAARTERDQAACSERLGAGWLGWVLALVCLEAEASSMACSCPIQIGRHRPLSRSWSRTTWHSRPD
jgi:hypothetical protein